MRRHSSAPRVLSLSSPSPALGVSLRPTRLKNARHVAKGVCCLRNLLLLMYRVCCSSSHLSLSPHCVSVRFDPSLSLLPCCSICAFLSLCVAISSGSWFALVCLYTPCCLIPISAARISLQTFTDLAEGWWRPLNENWPAVYERCFVSNACIGSCGDCLEGHIGRSFLIFQVQKKDGQLQRERSNAKRLTATV